MRKKLGLKIVNFAFFVLVGFLLLLVRKDLKETKQSDLQFYSGVNDLILSHGRVVKKEHYLEFTAPGTYFEFEYFGQHCDIYLADQIRYSHHNYIEVIVDSLKPMRLKMDDANYFLHLGKDLKVGKHHVLICKNTESSNGYIRLNGIRCHKLIPVKKTLNREIEFIGNSITCGNGADLSGLTCSQGEWYDQHNAYFSYGPTIARRFNANWTLSAVSGIGLTRSCCGMKHTMPEVYERINFSPKGKKWNFTNQKPSIVCITLGQNDGLQDKKLFVAAYIKFIFQLQQLYPDAIFICCSSPMANIKLREHLEDCILQVENSLSQLSLKKKVFHFFYKGIYTSGCKQHPTLDEHKKIARELGDFIETLNVWKN